MAWEYAQLFDVEAGDSAEPKIWDIIPSSIRIGTMGYRRHRITAGPRLEVEIYPVFGKEQREKTRQAKSNATPEAMARYNLEQAKRKVIRLADANFDERDIALTLTYAGDPPSYERAQKDVQNFLNKIKRRRKKADLPETKYIYTIEDNEDGRKHRIHVHMLLSGGLAREEIEQIWEKGYANADRLKPDNCGLEAIARYIMKQQRNRRKWCGSRNLKKPKEDKRDCRISNGRVKCIAYDFRNEAKETMEKLYPSYQFVRCEVRYSDIVDGVYIRCLMRRRKK